MRARLALAALFLFLLPAAARADSIQITLAGPLTRQIAPNSSTTFAGTLTNTTSSAVTVDFFFLGGTGTGPGVLLTQQLLEGPLTLAPGETTPLLNLFSVTAQADNLPALVGGVFQAHQFGTPFNVLLGRSETFHVAVNRAVPAPEPATLTLLAAGLAGVAVKARGRRKRWKVG